MILYAGSYTQEVGPGLSGVGAGIYCFNFNNETGELKLIHTLLNRNTSYIAISKNKKFLYSFQEVSVNENPVALAFKIKNDHTLELINKQPIKGSLPCHLSLMADDNVLGIACYGSGSIHLFQVAENGRLEKCLQNIFHEGKSANKDRQESAHAHMITVFKNEVFVPDLGIDAVVNYAFVKETKSLIEKYKVNIPLGEGPRHIVFHPSGKYAFVINELTGFISVLKEKKGEFKFAQNISSLPKNHEGLPSAAAIKISNCGTFLYCSNRGSESIAIFKFNAENGELNIVGQQPTGGKTPRDFTISPEGKWLLVANQDSNNIVVFKIEPTTGVLEKQTTNNESKSVVCLKWL